MAMIFQGDPNHNVSGDSVTFTVQVTNNDSGAVYNSGEFSSEFLGGVAQQLQQLPVNQGDSLSQIVQDFYVVMRGPPTGEVSNGWSASKSADGAVYLNHIAGIPGVSYTQWKATQQAPNQDMTATTFGVRKDRLELNGTDGYQPSPTGTWQPGYDAMLAKSTTQIPQMFTGAAGDNLNYWHANGHSVAVIPEPMTGALLAPAVLYFAGKRSLGKLIRSFF